MTNDDKFHHNERIMALHEAFGKTVTSRTLGLYWDALKYLALDDFDAAYVRASRELNRPATPQEIRSFARDSGRQREQVRHEATAALCHFHGDGEYELMRQGRPDEPSTNRTVWWCSRCTHFVKQGLQKEDKTGLPGPQLVRDLANSKSNDNPKETR